MNAWIAAEERDLADWFAQHCTTPSTMVDRIVPRSTQDDLAALEDRIGMTEAGAVFTETFSQWVLEDDFANGRPRWDRFGAQFVKNVAPFETAKLRMLNGAHSLLAYGGLRKGYRYVHEAVADADLAVLVRRLMLHEAAPSVAPADGQNLSAYAADLMRRFADPALRHSLAQIAMDGSQKIPQRWLDTLAWHVAREGKACAIRAAFDCWLWHLEDGRFVDDPHGDALSNAFQSGGTGEVLDLCFGARNDGALWSEYAHLKPALQPARVTQF